jgi:hypothetical protein
MELAPTLLPPRLDGLGLDLAELLTEPGLAGVIGVDGERIVSLLETLGMQLEQARRRLLP